MRFYRSYIGHRTYDKTIERKRAVKTVISVRDQSALGFLGIFSLPFPELNCFETVSHFAPPCNDATSNLREKFGDTGVLGVKGL